METDIHDKVQRLIGLAKAHGEESGVMGGFYAPEVRAVAEHAASLDEHIRELRLEAQSQAAKLALAERANGRLAGELQAARERAADETLRADAAESHMRTVIEQRNAYHAQLEPLHVRIRELEAQPRLDDAERSLCLDVLREAAPNRPVRGKACAALADKLEAVQHQPVAETRGERRTYGPGDVKIGDVVTIRDAHGDRTGRATGFASWETAPYVWVDLGGEVGGYGYGMIVDVRPAAGEGGE